MRYTRPQVIPPSKARLTGSIIKFGGETIIIDEPKRAAADAIISSMGLKWSNIPTKEQQETMFLMLKGL